jgi:hypothetical protein
VPIQLPPAFVENSHLPLPDSAPTWTTSRRRSVSVHTTTESIGAASGGPLGSLGTGDVNGHGGLQNVANAARASFGKLSRAMVREQLSRAMVREQQPRMQPPRSAMPPATAASVMAGHGPLPTSLALISLRVQAARLSWLGYELQMRGEGAWALQGVS